MDPIPDRRVAALQARRERLPLWYGLGLSLLLPVLVAGLLWYEYRHEQEAAAARAQALTQGIERELLGRLALVSYVLDMHAGRAHSPHGPGTAPRVGPIRLDVPLQGIDVVSGAAKPLAPVPRGREFLAGFEVGVPARRDGVWLLPVSRRSASGKRVSGWLDAAWLGETVQDYHLGGDDRINLLHENRVLVGRSHDNARYIGKRLDAVPLFSAPLRGQATGSFVEASVIDGVTRQFAFRRVAATPLILLVGTARREIVAPWIAFAATTSLITLLLAGLWAWLVRVQRQQRLRQERTEARLRQALALAELGEVEWDLATGNAWWSEQMYRVYGRDPADGPFTIAQNLGFIHPDDAGRLQPQIESLSAGGAPGVFEFRAMLPDGGIRWLHSRGERVRRPDGGHSVFGVTRDITDLVAARERLRMAETQYRILFEHNPMPMWVFERETLHFLAVNDAMLQHYGYAREDLVGRSILEIRPEEERAAVERMARGPAGSQGRVATHLHKDGSRLRAAIHTRDIEFEGRAARLVLAQDVTEQERNEQRFQLIARATNDAVWDWDFETGVTWRSDNVYPLFGYKPGEFGPSLSAWEDLLHPEDRDRVMANLPHLNDTGADEWESDYRLRRRDGTYAQVHDRAFLLRNAQGLVTRAVGGMIDVTEKHQQETDLRLLRRAVEATENGVSISDARAPDMPLVYVNAAFERITGYRAAEVLGRNCRFLQGEERDQLGRHEICHGLAEGRETRALLRNYRKDGTAFWNDLHVNPVRDDSGAVTHFVGVQYDVTERQRYQEQIAHLATHDELTGLPNRTLLLDRLQQAIASAARFGRGVGVLFADLDNFKLINDSLGHASGDHALRAVADRLAGCVREADTVGRIGGDEFVLLISEQADGRGMARVIERIEAAFVEPLEIGGAQHYLSCSIGHCTYPAHGTDAETLLMHADIAMYEAKQAGRNRAVEYREEFDAVMSDRLHLISRLREALAQDEFVLHFQPLFRANGTPSGLEALVRWQHPQRGLLAPGHFIAVCESSGLIVQLGRWVLREAARHHALLAARGLGHLGIAINVSALQFQPGLLDDVQAAIASHQLPRGALEIELTESAVMGDPEAAIAIMNRLNALGVSIAVDDFGTGYSSLAYLKRLPIARLKIDRSFVRDLGQDPDDEAICASIIALARSLGLRTVAEGVETDAQRRWLLAHGCDELQGFLLARPGAFDAIVETLLQAIVVDAD